MDQTELNELGHIKTSLKQVRYEFAKNAAGQYQSDDYPHHVTKFSDIKSHCQTCAEDESDRRNCRVNKCPFYPYRLGTNPFHGGNSQIARGVAA